VNRVKGAHRFRGKRTPCAVNNVQTESAQVPVRSSRIQVCPAIGGPPFIDFSERDRADEHAITLDEHEIGGRFHPCRAPYNHLASPTAISHQGQRPAGALLPEASADEQDADVGVSVFELVHHSWSSIPISRIERHLVIDHTKPFTPQLKAINVPEVNYIAALTASD
jgi:hypothetical protein